jgi:hypothetical protein
VTPLRTTLLVACLVALPAVRASAEQLVRGQVTVDASGGVTVADTVVAGPLTETLRHFAGREVEVQVSTSKVVTRVVSPERTELRGALDGDAFVERGRRVTLFGPAAALVPVERVCALDVWSFGAEACVVAVEGRTTGDWNLVHMFSQWPSPVDVIRSRRPVWVSARRDGRVHVQRGGTTGWLDEASVTLGEAPSRGIVDGVPR